ncbi:MAG: DUF362 domain-containing protein [Bacteroidia bacterium]|nr:MAG: DUF362 domain-containing protein [Bacteroidia bacterium]
MKRREFIIKSAAAGITAGAAYTAGGYGNLLAAGSLPAAIDIVAVRGGEAEAMFDMGISALGGMTNFVKKGQKVVIKPNIGWDVVPERAANTNPKLIKRIVEHCFRAGAKEVFVFDNTCDNWVKCYKNSMIEKYAKDAGARMVPGDSESYYQQVSIPGAKILKTTSVHEKILESDVFINVPILKVHSSAKMTANLKNMMGVVWDRKFWHSNNLHQCIADFGLFEKKPSLNIIDCYNVMTKNGPRGVSLSDVENMKAQIISTDWVAGDTAAARMLGLDPVQVDYIPMAHSLGVGSMEIEKMNIHKIAM